MSSEPTLPGRRVVVAGAARSGVAAAALLSRRGFRVTLSERRGATELGPEARALESAGVRLETGGHRAETFAAADLVVLSPGVPADLPAAAAARAAGVPVWAEVELGYRFLRGRLAGITGSNGKSTTTALAAHLLASAGLDAVACGNIGLPLCSLVDSDRPGRWYVAELSSFQLEGIDTLRPRVAALLNLSPDHLDRHRDFSAYRAAKERLFMNQGPEDAAVLNLDDPQVAGIAPGLRGRVEWFGTGRDPRPLFAPEGSELVCRRPGPSVLLPLSELPLRGAHNLSNVLAALSVAHLCGAPADRLPEGLRSFRPLPHRMESVGRVGGVEFVNDSKATNVDSALRAVESFDRPLVWILGGRDKGADWSSLRPALEGGRVRAVVTMGESAERIARALEGSVTLRRAAGMQEALRAARELARPGDVVLLSPACASFDLYRSYEERGDDFRSRVRALDAEEVKPGGTAAGL